VKYSVLPPTSVGRDRIGCSDDGPAKKVSVHSCCTEKLVQRTKSQYIARTTVFRRDAGDFLSVFDRRITSPLIVCTLAAV
jgi:hypothetical protein